MNNQIARQLVLTDNPVIAQNGIKEPVVLLDSNGVAATGFTFDDIPTGADVVLTGYSSGADGTISSSDTVNTAVRKLDHRTHNQVASDVILTGFTTGSDVTDLSDTDNVAEALAKLQNRLAVLEGA